MTYTSESSLNSKDIVNKVNLCIKKLLIQCNTGNCCAQKISDINVIYICVRILVLVCPVCVCLCT